MPCLSDPSRAEALPRAVRRGAPTGQSHGPATNTASHPAYAIHRIGRLRRFPRPRKVVVTRWVVSVCAVTSVGGGGYLRFALEGAQLALKKQSKNDSDGEAEPELAWA